MNEGMNTYMSCRGRRKERRREGQREIRTKREITRETKREREKEGSPRAHAARREMMATLPCQALSSRSPGTRSARSPGLTSLHHEKTTQAGRGVR